MRFKVGIEFDESLELPFNYNKILQGFIYRNIMDKDLAQFIHDKGFSYEKRKYKMFTFSRLQGKFSIDSKRKKIIYQSPVELIVSSCYDDFFIDLSLSLLKRDVEIASHKAYVSKMDIIMEEPKSIQKIRMLSPVTAYSTLDDKRTVYFSPYNHDFKRIIRDNLIKKYKAFYKKNCGNDMDFDIEIASDKCTKVISNYDGFIIEGWMGDFVLRGNQELIKLAYDAGVGGKNSQGFGCFKLI
ncbi:MAG TPA: CRISPR-associated endoribonuclease Cas6 [Acetivibrio thermocellus]|uniref:CRISPR-associated endoribonuclease Cas6 n=1 Tax=Acetivibrio thermocellus TaxID=1515 RepID=UPI0010A61715|nr:CRISPR-associated endoribonuclease Cas6 [Acetivibrio thermocellus]THJ77527.1 CRISPR-associated endoribonuclease Cas6 [Acetivibrio thermocellus]HOP93389.1 CRISPR-associated endoribonuclease Cas6 [Acetivibrio thermocellus]